MSPTNQTQLILGRNLRLAPTISEPAVWFQELRLLSRLSKDEDAEIRKIPLKPGLNVLWSPPEEPESGDAVLYQEGWGGHAAGKTLFCRILRHLLGEPNFATKAVVSNIEGKFSELWAVARVRVNGESWIVGRSLLHAHEKWAERGDDIAVVLDSPKTKGDFGTFHACLDDLAAGALEKQYPTEAWRHLLPWLARDQEARYARVTAWRDSLSEADRPATSAEKQYALMRAVLGLLNPREHVLQSELEEIDALVRKLEPEIEQKAAVEARERHLLLAASRVALGKELALEDLKAAASLLQSNIEVRRQRLDQLENAPEAPAVRDARQDYEKAHGALISVRREVEEHSKRAEALMKQGNEWMAKVDRAKSSGITDPKRAMAGWCPRTREWAEKEGCIEKISGSDGETGVTIAELEQQATQLLEQGQQAETERARAESRVDQLDADAKARAADYSTAVRQSRRDAISIQREVSLLEQCMDRLSAYAETARALGNVRGRFKTNLEAQTARREEVGNLRDAAEAEVRYFSEVYGDIIKAVVGASVEGWIKVDGNGMHLHATKQGELSGAALETVKTLAYDLAGVVAGMEGKCLHPRFLIHDGPREADMSRVIYEKFFLYVVDRLEAAFASKSQATFQYIVTTTSSPPAHMKEGSEWLIAKLSSRTKQERLLCENV